VNPSVKLSDFRRVVSIEALTAEFLTDDSRAHSVFNAI
jgi:hypothetical protein